MPCLCRLTVAQLYAFFMALIYSVAQLCMLDSPHVKWHLFPASKHAQQEARQHQAHPLLWWARSESHLDALFLYLAQKIQINNAVGTFNLKFSPPNFSGCIFWHWKLRRPRPVAPAPSTACGFVQFWPFATCIFVHDALASPCPPCRAVRAVRQRRKAPRRPRLAVRPRRLASPRAVPCRPAPLVQPRPVQAGAGSAPCARHPPVRAVRAGSGRAG